MTLILCSFCLLAAPKGPTASKRWPIVFVPFIHGAGGYTALDNNNLETGELAASFAVFYLKNYLVGGAQGEYRYFTATNRAKGESESFSGLEGSLLFGVYFKEGSKILAGWTPYSEIKSTASLSKYRGSGIRGQLHWMVSYPLQIILAVKQLSYDEKIDADGTVTELSGNTAIKQMIFSLGVGYEF